MSTGVPGAPLVSFLGNGESRLKDKAEMVLWWPIKGSDPGTGDGAAEPFAAAAALRSSSLTWEACCSVRYATCLMRKSTVTSNRAALRVYVSR